MKVQIITSSTVEAALPEYEVIEHSASVLTKETIPDILFKSKIQHILDPKERDNSIQYFGNLCDQDDVVISDDGKRASIMGGDDVMTLLLVLDN